MRVATHLKEVGTGWKKNVLKKWKQISNMIGYKKNIRDAELLRRKDPARIQNKSPFSEHTLCKHQLNNCVWYSFPLQSASTCWLPKLLNHPNFEMPSSKIKHFALYFYDKEFSVDNKKNSFKLDLKNFTDLYHMLFSSCFSFSLLGVATVIICLHRTLSVASSSVTVNSLHVLLRHIHSPHLRSSDYSVICEHHSSQRLLSAFNLCIATAFAPQAIVLRMPGGNTACCH